MSDVTTLALLDSGLVSRNFVPTNVEPSLVEFHYKNGSQLEWPSVTMGRRKPTASNGNRKISIRVKVPVLETVTAAASGYTPGPTVAYTVSANVDWIVPARATAAEIADSVAYVQNALAHAVVENSVQDDDFPY